MAMRDEDFGAALTLTEVENGSWSPPMSAPVRGPRDWQSLDEQAHARAERERARADAAEARAEELRGAEADARSGAGSLKSQLDKSRDTLKAGVEETKAVRRAAKDARFFQAEVTRLEKLLSEAGVDSRRRSTSRSLRMEVVRLREALPASQARKETTAPPSAEKVKPPKAAPAPQPGKDTTGALSRENARVRKSLERTQAQNDEGVALRRLGKKRKGLRARNARLEAPIARCRSTRAVLSKALYASKSEKQDKARSERKRGQQRGAPGHARTQRPALEEKEQRHNPPQDARVCACCQKPYVGHGELSSTVIEIEVKAHIRRIVRPRDRRGCDGASLPLEVTAPPVPRLFPRTPDGTSVWARVLFEHFACFGPLRRVAPWLADQGLAVSPGTLAVDGCVKARVFGEQPS